MEIEREEAHRQAKKCTRLCKEKMYLLREEEKGEKEGDEGGREDGSVERRGEGKNHLKLCLLILLSNLKFYCIIT